jgi:hypothetical protein
MVSETLSISVNQLPIVVGFLVSHRSQSLRGLRVLGAHLFCELAIDSAVFFFQRDS